MEKRNNYESADKKYISCFNGLPCYWNFQHCILNYFVNKTSYKIKYNHEITVELMYYD